MPFDPKAFLASRGAAPLNVVEEMHPDISSIDRLVVKNLANAPEVGVNYIKKKLPGHDVRLYGGRMVVKAPGDKEYRVMDPDTGFFSKDILNDAGDVLTDVGSGVAEGAATAAGAVAGGLPGAMIAGGASGAGLEAARQGLGKLAGLEQDIDGTDVAISGGLSAALPAIGAAAKGTYNIAKKKVLPVVAEWASGVPRGAVSRAVEKFPTLEMLQKEGGPEDLIEEGVQKKVKNAIYGRQSEVGKQIEETVAGLKGSVNLEDARSPFNAVLSQFKKDADELGTDSAKQRVSDLEASIKSLLGEKEVISPAGANALQRELGEVAGLAKTNKEGLLSRFSANASLNDKKVMEAARKSRDILNSQLDDMSGKALAPLNKEYGAIKNDLRYLGKTMMKSPENTYSMLTSLRNKPLRLSRLSKIDKRYGTNILESAKDLDMAKYLGKPALNAQSGLGATSTTRTIGAAGVGSSIGTLLGYQSDSLPGSPYARAAVGGGIGATLGATLGSPAMLKAVIKNALKAERAAAKIKPGTVPGVIKSAWEMGRENR